MAIELIDAITATVELATDAMVPPPTKPRNRWLGALRIVFITLVFCFVLATCGLILYLAFTT
jgi:hypothetical protein